MLNKKINKRVLFFILMDIILISLSVFLSFIIRFEANIPIKYLINIKSIILLSILVALPIFYLFKLYHFTWAYVSTEELISLIKGVGLSFFIIILLFIFLRDLPFFSGFPRSTLFISYFFIFLFCGGIRFLKRFYSQIFSSKYKKQKERTLIVGAGDAGEQILRGILSFKASPYLPVGFVDDDIEKQGTLIHGLKVLGKIEDIPKVVEANNVEGLIVAIPSALSQTIYTAVEKGREANLKKIKIVPGLEEIMSGKVTLGQLKEVAMDELLGREEVTLDKKSIESFIKNKKVLVTGGAGSIGSELCRQIAKFNPNTLIILDQDETGIFNIDRELTKNFKNLDKVVLVADIRDEVKIDKIFKEYQPEVVFHAAAYKHVPLMEESPDEAIKNNVFGTNILAKVSLNYKVAKFVIISTDKAVNPVSVMGTSKRIAEMIGQVANNQNITKFISVRFGNVLDSRGSVIPIFREKIKNREPIEVTHSNMQRYFMTTPEACLLVMQAGAIGSGGEVFILDMGDPVKIVDLARELIKLSGLVPDIDIPIVFSEPRPGEKMFEELLTNKESMLTTTNEKILQVKLNKVNEVEFEKALVNLKEVFYNMNNEEMVVLLNSIIKI